MKDLIILGMGHTRHCCPFDKEVWTVNAGFKKAKRVDLVFQMHDYMNHGELDELKAKKFTVVCKAPIEGLDCIVYPIKEIIHSYNSMYFSSTVCYMIAYAMYLGYEAIDLYGIDHSFTSEYVLSKGGVEYWIGRAEGIGVKIDIPKDSALCKTPGNKLYGYDTDWFDANHHEKIMVANTIGGNA